MIICTGRRKRYLYWIRQMSVREERHCENDDGPGGMRSNPTPVSMCRVSTREITRVIYSREKFFHLPGHVSSRRGVLVLGKATVAHVGCIQEISSPFPLRKTGPLLASQNYRTSDDFFFSSNCKRKIVK